MLAISQPDSDDRWLWPNAKDEVLRHCKFQVGSRWWVAEAFYYQPAEYAHEMSSTVPLIPETLTYGGPMSPAIMPQWMSRTDAVVLAVRLERGEVWEWAITMRGERHEG
jgi:hypothetical protein